MIYNDAYSAFAGQRHPRLLGSKVLEGWAEVADFNAHVMRVGLAGGALSFKDQELTLLRNGRPEQVWMDLNYSPLLDEDGRPAGVLAIVVETTARLQAERRGAFLTELGDGLRELSEPVRQAEWVAGLLGRLLGAERVGWAKVDAVGGVVTVEAEWRAGGALLSAAGGADVPDPAWAAARLAEAVREDDPRQASVSPTPRTGVGAIMTAPVIRNGQLAAFLFAQAEGDHAWSDDERVLAREAAVRTWAAQRRAVAEAQVRESEARLRALVNATSDVIYRMNPDWSEMRQLDGRGFLASTERSNPAWMDMYLLPEDRPAIRAAIQKAIREKKPFQLEHRVRRADGGVGWTFSRAIPILDEQGRVIEWFGAASDVTGRKESEQHLRLVINELNHRVKNNLAMIQAISAQTFRNADDLTNAQASFTARILNLAKANDLLTHEHWVDASLRAVILSAVQPHLPQGAGRLVIEGPSLRLPAKTALSLSMALHELATNAVKYGAWSREEGKVSVVWSLRSQPPGRRLHMEWRESEGPPVSPPTRRGFGSRLIERGLAAELQGEVALHFNPEGLACVVDAPLREPD
jgi:two-component sensor histidine kinase